MYTKRLLIAVVSCLLLQSAQESHAKDAMLGLIWERYAEQAATASREEVIKKAWELYIAKAVGVKTEILPGRTIGEDPAIDGFLSKSGWQYRASSYELYFASSRILARSVYGLAIYSGDVDKTMPLERFEKGVRGFHYSMKQLCGWIDTVRCGVMPLHTDEERQLMQWLEEDRAIRVINGRTVADADIHHILGAAPGKKRSFDATLRHERLHVLWDEAPGFADSAREKWAAMTDGEKAEIRKTLAAYAQSNEPQLMEEWAIYQAENMPEAERRALIGL